MELFSTDWAGLQAEKTGFVGFSAMRDRVGTMVGMELYLVKETVQALAADSMLSMNP